ncbi:Ap-3 complex subunit beta [Plakobranchus ocellatus]|uniref:AP-3 complex subunit beta n=1 Tax=Plakobranchus ocellatus TaxID=259542 RepID=A0AAV4CFD9_9GAST|nr:Ap-3 complex subunit beta [Plakobranchus ocellatus]
MAGNGFQASSYANDRPPSSTGSGEGDISTDPASSGFFTTDFKKHDDLKTMLDSNKDSLKLEAMKRIIGMVAKGKDASDLFPPVVKNVVSKNLEVKKLVYVYLTRYAEEQQDLALLSISTFQRALKDPNQLIRASALRVLSSIRVPVITPIMMLAIKEAVMDMSPYVRKTAAHAIPKLYSLDPETKEQLIEVLDRLLADKTTLVAGSAIQAFVEICPERIDLIHKNYRKLCNLLVDVEEWGQVVILNMLTHYCRTQFISPNQDGAEESERPFYESSEKDSDEEGDDEHDDSEKKKKAEKLAPYVMDHDHRLLLRQSKPLLNSRNAAVVMAVAQLYHHCAPKSEVGIVAKSLIRLLRSHKEIQYVVLSNIATMTDKRKGMFEPYLKSFYVRSCDPLHVKLLKLEILTSLATETNISTILREFQTYVTSSDKDFAAATIQAIGRCASSIAEVTDTCLNGLVRLMSNRDEAVVAESVVVIKKLLQMRPSEHKSIICHMAKMVDKITVPMARASILWLIGEYSERVPKIAPDVLRRMAKNFINEEDIVKLQILNLAVKLCITNPKQTKLLCQYVLNLAKYDQNYDIRDRSRFLRQFVLSTDKPCALAKYSKKIFLATKPAPVLESLTKAHDNYQLGSLSHLLNMKTTGYQELPEWPSVAPDPTVRNVEVPPAWKEERETVKGKKTKQKQPSTDLKSFYSSSSEDEDDDDDDDDDDSSEEESEDESVEGKDASEESGEEEEEEEEAEEPSSDSSADSSDSSDDSDEDSSEEDSSEDESEKEVKKPAKAAPVEEKPKKTSKSKAEAKPSSGGGVDTGGPDLLLDLDDLGPALPNPAAPGNPSMGAGNLLTPTAAGSGRSSPSGFAATAQSNIVQGITISPKEYELLNRLSTGGLSVTYKYTRTISAFSSKMVSLELTFLNAGDKPFTCLKIGDKKIQPGMEIHDFPEIASLGVGSTSMALMGINFNDTTQAAGFQLSCEQGSFPVSISAPVGELMQPHTMGESEFKSQQGKLGGMNENKETVAIAENNSSPEGLCLCVRSVANLLQVPSSQSDVYLFAAQTLATSTLVLVSIKVQGKSSKVTVNCEKMVIGTMLMKDLKKALVA